MLTAADRFIIFFCFYKIHLILIMHHLFTYSYTNNCCMYTQCPKQQNVTTVMLALLQITTVIFTDKLLMFRQQLLPSTEWLLPTRRPRGEQEFVIDVTQLVGTLVSIHDILALLPNVDSLPDPPCSSVRLPGDDCCLVPVDNLWVNITAVICN